MLNMNKSDRLIYGETMMTHAMVLTAFTEEVSNRNCLWGHSLRRWVTETVWGGHSLRRWVTETVWGGHSLRRWVTETVWGGGRSLRR